MRLAQRHGTIEEQLSRQTHHWVWTKAIHLECNVLVLLLHSHIRPTFLYLLSCSLHHHQPIQLSQLQFQEVTHQHHSRLQFQHQLVHSSMIQLTAPLLHGLIGCSQHQFFCQHTLRNQPPPCQEACSVFLFLLLSQLTPVHCTACLLMDQLKPFLIWPFQALSLSRWPQNLQQQPFKETNISSIQCFWWALQSLFYKDKIN